MVESLMRYLIEVSLIKYLMIESFMRYLMNLNLNFGYFIVAQLQAPQKVQARSIAAYRGPSPQNRYHTRNYKLMIKRWMPM